MQTDAWHLNYSQYVCDILIFFSKLMSLININEYAYQIIFIQDYKMKGLVQIVSLMITTRNNDDTRAEINLNGYIFMISPQF